MGCSNVLVAAPQPLFAKASNKMHSYSYSIGEKGYIDSLFPTVTPSPDASCRPSEAGSGITTTDNAWRKGDCGRKAIF